MKLSTCSSTCINWIPGILKSFRALHPGITVEVVSGFCNSQLTAKLRADEMLCVTSADFELRNHWYVVSDDLQGLPNMISYGDYGEEALPVAQHMGITAGSSFTSVDDTSLVALAESGLGFNRPDGKKQANNFWRRFNSAQPPPDAQFFCA